MAGNERIWDGGVETFHYHVMGGASCLMGRRLSLFAVAVVVLLAAVPVVAGQTPIVFEEEEIYKDDFNSGDGWSRAAGQTGNRDYVAGEYEIIVYRQNWLYLATSPVKAPTANYAVEAEVRMQQGDKSEYGFAFNYNDAGGYFFGVNSADRQYKVYRLNGYTNKWTDIIKETKSDFINDGSKKNFIRLVQSGSQVDFYVNGNYLASIEMKTFAKRDCDILLYARNLGVEECHARFDNFRLCTITLK